MDAQFYFGNINFLKEQLRKLEASRASLRAVIIDGSSMNQLDSSADTALHELVDDYKARGIQLALANIKQPVRTVMERSHLLDVLGSENVFLTVHDAVCALTPEHCDEEKPEPTPEPTVRGPQETETLAPLVH